MERALIKEIVKIHSLLTGVQYLFELVCNIRRIALEHFMQKTYMDTSMSALKIGESALLS